MARSSKNTPANSAAVVATTGSAAQTPVVGFSEQQFQYIQYAVANKSLGFTFQVHPMIQQFINYYQGRGHSTMEIGLYRSGMFMSMARRIFREEGVPENMAWLGQVESTWKPTALSWAAASGLWQFIPGTGSRFGLQRTAYVDERNSFDEATRASARYLKFLAARYNGNWELAMAAYNSGEGNVDRAIRRSGSMNFWSSYQYLPQETRNYVPNILATILIANNPRQYGFGHIQPAAPLRYDRVKVPGSTNLNILAQASDTTVQYLRYLNPHLRSNTTPPEPYIINVPPGKANEVVAVFKRANATKINSSNLATTQTGETWQTISNRTGISVADLIAANPGMKEPKGKVFVPMASNRVATIAYTRPSSQPTGPATSNLKIVKALAGDTVAKLATRNNADPTEVAKFNGLLPNSVLGAGREIKIPNK
jgi:membrane-bound lytic murein transglycosylase D